MALGGLGPSRIINTNPLLMEPRVSIFNHLGTCTSANEFLSVPTRSLQSHPPSRQEAELAVLGLGAALCIFQACSSYSPFPLAAGWVFRLSGGGGGGGRLGDSCVLQEP